MSVRPEVQEELRRLFRQGATPSRLIQHIAARHRGEKRIGPLAVIYFMETFGVPFIHNLNPLDDFQSIGLRYAFLNDDTLHEMIQAKATWDQGASEPSWLDPLTATSVYERLDRAKQGCCLPELESVWDSLDESQRFAIQRAVAGYNGCTEQVRILAQLAERLQQRINELEAERAPADELASKNGK